MCHKVAGCYKVAPCASTKTARKPLNSTQLSRQNYQPRCQHHRLIIIIFVLSSQLSLPLFRHHGVFSLSLSLHLSLSFSWSTVPPKLPTTLSTTPLCHHNFFLHKNNRNSDHNITIFVTTFALLHLVLLLPLVTIGLHRCALVTNYSGEAGGGRLSGTQHYGHSNSNTTLYGNSNTNTHTGAHSVH